MTERQPPLWIDGGCYTGEDLRGFFGTISTCPNGGVVARGDLAPSAPGGMIVRIAIGAAWVAGTQNAGQGSYLVRNPSTTDVAIPPADPANPRIDLIVARVYDPTYGATGAPRWALENVKGTPATAGTQQPPAVPASSLVLCHVAVGAAVAAITPANITDNRVVCSGVGDSPTGTLVAFGGVAAPAGWLLCDGTAYSRTLYGPLFNIIGTRYGAGDGSTTFNVPNALGQVLAGMDAGQGEFAALGTRGGSKAASMPYHNHSGATTGSDRDLNHQHSVNTTSTGQSAWHTHGMDGSNQFSIQAVLGGTSGPVQGGSDGWTRGTRARTDVDGTYHTHDIHAWTDGGQGGVDHLHYVYGDGGTGNNLPPYLVVNYIIRF
jgi:microcystin-dependent protein